MVYLASPALDGVLKAYPKPPKSQPAGSPSHRGFGYRGADLNRDGDVESPFAIFHRCFSGEGIPADPNCAN